MRIRIIETKKVIFDSVEEVNKVWDLIENSDEVESIKEDYTYMVIDDTKQEIEFLLEKIGFENPIITSDLGFHQGSGASFTADYFYLDEDNKIDINKLKESYPQYTDIIDSFKGLYDEVKGVQVEAYYDSNSFRTHYLHSKTINWHITEDCDFYIERDGHVGYEESMLESIEDEVERTLNDIYFKCMSDEEAFKEGLVEDEVEFDLTKEMEERLTNTKGDKMSNSTLRKDIESVKNRVYDLFDFSDILEEEGYEVASQDLRNKVDEILTHLNGLEDKAEDSNSELAEKGKYKVVFPVSYMAPVCENLYKYFNDKEEAEKWLSDIKEGKVHPGDLYGDWNVEGTEVCDDGVSDTCAEPDEAEIITL